MTNERPGICGPCGGQCCKNGPGRYHPDDFPVLADDLRLALATGRVCLDWWEGDFEGFAGPVYYVRPAEKGHEGQLLHPGWEGECVNLTASGCALSFSSRPWQCRALVPKSGGRDCHYPEKLPTDSYKAMGVRVWLPHQELLRSIADNGLSTTLPNLCKDGGRINFTLRKVTLP